MGAERQKEKDAQDNDFLDTIIATVAAEKLTRESGITFNVTDVVRPLVSAVRICDAGNRIVMDPDPEQSYVENLNTGERIKLRRDKGTFVFDVQYSCNGEMDTVTLWPKHKLPEVELLPKKEGLKMIAANGTPIQNLGQKIVKFRGISHEGKLDFTRRA